MRAINDEVVGPAISAHRGGSEGVVPGSVDAYRQAVSGGADLIEVDIWRSADGVLLCTHSGVGSHGKRWSDLADVDIERTVPRLVEILDLGGPVGLHIDLKEVGYEHEVVEFVLARASHPERVYFTSLEDTSVAAIAQRFPEVRVALSLGRGTKGMSLLRATKTLYAETFPFRRLRASRANAVATNFWLYTPFLARYCRRNDIHILVWTVNTDRHLTRFLVDPHIDVLITDRPHAARRLRDALTG